VIAIAELLRYVRDRGAEVRLGGPTGIEVIHHRRLDGAILAELRQAKSDLRRALQAELEAVAIVSAQRLLRDCNFQLEAAPCSFHCGYPGGGCRRCGGRWPDHYPSPRGADV
jgi:hypothetical protein